MTEIIELKRLLRDHWSVVKDTKKPIADRRISAEAIMDLQAQITEIDKTFSSIDLRNTSYAELLQKSVTKSTEIKSSLDDNFVRTVRDKATYYFEIKKIVQDVAKTKFSEFDNGPSVGQVLQMIIDNLQK